MTNTLERSNHSTRKRNEYPDAPRYTHKIQSELDTEANKMQFGETLYIADEEDTLQ